MCSILDLKHKLKFYGYILCNLAIDGCFIAVSGVILSSVHHWMQDIPLDGFYKQIINWLVYSLDAMTLPPLIIWLIKDLLKSIRMAFNDGRYEK